jgi:hypothetical protein
MDPPPVASTKHSVHDKPSPGPSFGDIGSNVTASASTKASARSRRPSYRRRIGGRPPPTLARSGPPDFGAHRNSANLPRSNRPPRARFARGGSIDVPSTDALNARCFGVSGVDHTDARCAYSHITQFDLIGGAPTSRNSISSAAPEG